MEDIKKAPEKFSQVIRDFLADLTIAFPEYVFLWENLDDIQSLYEYCLTVYPERFFDILYQNDDIFLYDSGINTMFLPNVEFKALYSTPDISENTKKALWKYLQLVLITIIGNIKSSASFGDTASIFEGIDEDELQTKLADTVNGLSEFFHAFSPENAEENACQEEGESEASSSGPNSDTIPSVDELHDHIKGLFDGKIGSLAKEMAEELSGDVMHMFDDGTGEIKSTGDILKKMMRNPKKIMELVKKISKKLDDKMKSGNISQEEIMKEASEMMTKMKGMGNGKEFQDMMQNMMKTMGMGKGAKMDMNKMNMMMNRMSNKERLRAKLDKRKEFVLEKKEESGDSNEMVFKIPEEGSPEKSVARQVVPSKSDVDLDDWLNESPANPGASSGKKGKKGNKKAGKK
jgi:hypothetical protein|uniref:Uncharacterized protein n=1 Tax=viral metagenome TaxID=1070528 RepID=A0A6C0DZH7_9ZZZZ